MESFFVVAEFCVFTNPSIFNRAVWSLDPRVWKERVRRLWQSLQNAGLIWAWRDSVLYADAQAMRGSRVMNAHMPGDASEPSPCSIYNARSRGRGSGFRWRFAGRARAQGALRRAAAVPFPPPSAAAPTRRAHGRARPQPGSPGRSVGAAWRGRGTTRVRGVLLLRAARLVVSES